MNSILGFLSSSVEVERALSRLCYKVEVFAGPKPKCIVNTAFGGTTLSVFMDHLAHEVGFVIIHCLVL